MRSDVLGSSSDKHRPDDGETEFEKKRRKRKVKMFDTDEGLFGLFAALDPVAGDEVDERDDVEDYDDDEVGVVEGEPVVSIPRPVEPAAPVTDGAWVPNGWSAKDFGNYVHKVLEVIRPAAPDGDCPFTVT